jgi:microcystin-dependent protein
MTEIFGSMSSGVSPSSAGTTGSFPFSWEHPVAWPQLRKYFEKSVGEEESKKLISILESNAKSLEDFLEVAYLKVNGGSVFGKVNFEGNVNVVGYINIPPPGTVVQWAGASTLSPPSGWLFANGSLQSIAEYPDLYNTLTNSGTTFPYGPNEVSQGLRFRLPNLAGRVPVGIDAGQTEFDTMGETGGAKTHTLSSAEMPAHAHTVWSISSNPASFNSPFGLGMTTATTSNADKTTSIAGSGQAHNNLQPYIVLNYIIKH